MVLCGVSRFDSHSFFASKINKDISYPEMLNLRPFMSKNQVQYQYIFKQCFTIMPTLLFLLNCCLVLVVVVE